VAEDTSTLPFASVAIPARNEEKAIRECLEGVLAQDYPRDRLEVLLVDGDSDDRTREIAEEVAAMADVPVRVIANPRRIIPAAINRAIEAARGEYLVRVDAHSVPAADYVRRAIEGNLESGAALVGGWVQPEGRTGFARAVAAAFRSPFAMGNAVSWQPPGGLREVASVPCGSYRLDALRAIGGYDEAQLANEDYEANFRLRRMGERVMLSPHVSFRYLPRENLSALARQFVRYGFYKARVMVKHPSSVRPRHAVPAGGLAVVLVLAAAAPAWTTAGWILLALATGYVVALAVASVLAARGLGREALWLPVVFATMHVAWGGSNLVGLLRWLPARGSFAPAGTLEAVHAQ
jgi:cellulose synthase/poly-beta-1,6-N-acetylglucosamine synthase-like glycosyltransferase